MTFRRGITVFFAVKILLGFISVSRQKHIGRVDGAERFVKALLIQGSSIFWSSRTLQSSQT
jgi:hypothetical protein